MSNVSTQDRESNPDAQGRVQFASDVLSEESRFMKAIFMAIAELAPRQDMAKTVVELANCGQWISDNLNCNVDYWTDQVISKMRGVAA